MSDGVNSSGGWCGRGDKPRVFPKRDVIICYDKCPAASVDREEYDSKRHNALLGSKITSLTVPKKSARTWKMQKGDLCRITVVEGPQVKRRTQDYNTGKKMRFLLCRADLFPLSFHIKKVSILDFTITQPGIHNL